MRKFLFIILLMPLLARANDTAFGGSGATPIPIKQANITMQSEHIVITGHDIERTDLKGSWTYRCDYIFKNDADANISLQMGFPFPVNDELSETTTPLGYTTKKGGALVYNFQVTVNGHTVPTRKSKIKPLPDEGMYYDEAYLWNMNIPAHETVNIHHDYMTGVTINVMGQNYVSFVLKTGRLWKGGNIKAATFEVTPNTPTRLCSELNKAADYLQPKPAGIKIIGEGKERRYVWQLKNFIPNEDLELCLINSKNYVKYYIVYPVVQGNDTELNLKKLSKNDLRLLKNSIYAQHGRRFQDPELQNYFNKQWWYEPNANYSDALLSEDDRKAIAIIQKQEARV